MFIGEQADAQPALDVLRKAFDIPAVTMSNEGWTNNDTWLKWHGEDKTDPAGLNAFMSTMGLIACEKIDRMIKT